MTTVAAKPAAPAAEEKRHRLTALEGVAALSLDALLSVAYGPEAIVIVLAAADPQRRIVVLVPEVEPASPSQDILYDHRGLVLDRAIRKTCPDSPARRR